MIKKVYIFYVKLFFNKTNKHEKYCTKRTYNLYYNDLCILNVRLIVKTITIVKILLIKLITKLISLKIFHIKIILSIY